MKQEQIQKKLRKKFLKKGVKMISPETIFFSNKTKIGKNVSIEPYVVFVGSVILKNNIKIKSFSHLEDVKVENNVSIGPYARLRPGTILDKGAKVGNFVEVKKSKIGKNSKVSHLSYIGDANLGKNVNVGAGTITCNYDGVNKHQTRIGDRVFIGSGVELVAPIEVESGATVGAGSTISKHAPSNKLTIERSKQKTIDSWKRPTKKEEK